MRCSRVTLPGGQTAIVCGSRPKRRPCSCGSGRPAVFLCDWKVDATAEPAKTCDAAICSACTHQPVNGKDLCPTHAARWREMKRERREATDQS